jgi:hypothetical protein
MCKVFFIIASSISHSNIQVTTTWVLCLVAGENPANFAMQKLTSEHNTLTDGCNTSGR